MVFSSRPRLRRPPATGNADGRCRPLAVGLCRPLAALLWCHFPERDTFGRLGAAAVDQGTALAGFARQGQRKNQNNKHMDSFVLKVFELPHESY